MRPRSHIQHFWLFYCRNVKNEFAEVNDSERPQNGWAKEWDLLKWQVCVWCSEWYAMECARNNLAKFIFPLNFWTLSNFAFYWCSRVIYRNYPNVKVYNEIISRRSRQWSRFVAHDADQFVVQGIKVKVKMIPTEVFDEKTSQQCARNKRVISTHHH